VREALPEISRELRTVLLENIAAQRGPDGRPWPATQDGRQALKNAGEDLTVQVVNNTILATLTGIPARHHTGAARGKVRRPILPTKGIPAPVVEAIGRVVRRKLGGGA